MSNFITPAAEKQAAADPVLGLYALHRKEAERLWPLIPHDVIKAGGAVAAMRTCGTYLAMRYYLDGHRELHEASWCRSRLCPMCQWRAAVEDYRAVMRAITAYMPSSTKYIHITLTCTNVKAAHLPATITRLIDSERELYKALRKEKVLTGRIRSVEITVGKDGSYHPHIHVMACVPEHYGTHGCYLSQKRLRRIWGDLINERDPRCFMQLIQPNHARGIAGAVAEVTKYAVKTAQLTSPDHVREIYYATKGRRLWSSAGDIKRALAMVAKEPPKDIGREGIDFIIKYYRWFMGCYKEVNG